MAIKFRVTPQEMLQYFQEAARVQERLQLSGQLEQAGLLRARRNALARAAQKRPQHAARYQAQLKELHVQIADADERTLRQAMEIKSRPLAKEGGSVSGRTLDSQGAAKSQMTVAILGDKDEVLAWTVSDIGGWYALPIEATEGAAYLQVSDERGTVIAKEPLKQFKPGSILQKDFKLSQVKSKGTAPPQSSVGKRTDETPVGVASKQRAANDLKRAALLKTRDAKADEVKQATAVVAALDERTAALKDSQAEVSASLNKTRAQVNRGKTTLNRLATELKTQKAGSVAYRKLTTQIATRTEKQKALEAELSSQEANLKTLQVHAKQLAAERKSADTALTRAKTELATAQSELAALK